MSEQKRRPRVEIDKIRQALGGGIVIGTEGREPGPLERLALLTARARRLADPARSPYQGNFTRFCEECVWTKDEAGGGIVRQMPPYPYLRDLDVELLTRERLFIEKSRRVLASWRVCAFDVWVASGGRDPRWVLKKPDGSEQQILMQGTGGNRQVYVAAQAFDEADWYLQERVRFLVNASLEHGLREKWPEFPEWVFSQGKGVASNGSRIDAAAQGSDVLRGRGATLLHFEEVGVWVKAKQTVEGALPTLRGGGHLVCISTANAGTYAADLVAGRLRGEQR